METNVNVRRLVVCGLLVALAVLLGGPLSIPVFSAGVYSLNIGFGMLPVLLCAVLFGPLYGGMAGGLTDIIKALLFPLGAYVPWFTLVGILFGLIPGLFFKNGQRPTTGRLFLAVGMGQIICSVLLNTCLLVLLYGRSFVVLLPARLIEQAIMVPLFVAFLHFLAPRVSKRLGA